MNFLAALTVASTLVAAPDDSVVSTKLAIVATHPALASITQQIGGDLVTVTSICKPTGDVHSVDASPSVLAQLKDAAAFVHSGLDLEMWTEDALKGCGNDRIQAGARGNIDCSTGVEMLNVPANPSRADGDVHLYGNPHYWLDPLNGRKIAENVANGLSALDPKHAADYASRREQFDADLKKRLVGWLKAAIPFKNTTIVCYHDSFPYFARRFGFQVVGFVEPKPRIPPTQAHLASLIDLMRDRQVKVILREPYHDPKATEFLAEKTGAKVVTVSQMPQGIDGTPTYQDLIERDLNVILDALR